MLLENNTKMPFLKGKYRFSVVAYLFNDLSLQGQDPLAKVKNEGFSVIKLAKIVKKQNSTTSVFGNGGLVELLTKFQHN